MHSIKFSLIAIATMSLLACGSTAKKDEAPAPTDDAGSPTDPGGGDNSTDAAAKEPLGPPKPMDAGSVSDAGSTDAGKDAGPTNRAECITACEVQFPKAAATDKKLDECYVGVDTCGTVCNDLGYSANLFEPDPAADGTLVCDTVKASSDPIVTASKACSNCLAGNATCCGLWISIFGSIDGRGLNMCANACDTKFKN